LPAKCNKVRLDKAHKDEFDITLMCEVLGVSRTSYYDRQKALPSSRAIENNLMSDKIRIMFTECRNNYGTRRLKRALAKEGLRVSRRRIGRLMRSMGLS